MSGFLIDTNIFSEIFKNNDKIIRYVLDLEAYIDTTVYIECLQGSKSKTEKAAIKRLLASFPIISINESIAANAISLIDKYSNSHRLLLADALIASSAMSAGLTIVTFNLSDFQFVDGLTAVRPN